MFFSKITITAALVAAVKAHMIMSSPSPFDPEHLDNFPLDASGSDFPCKIGHSARGGTYQATGGKVNQYELGSHQQLSFVGQTVHGGGSCQVVMTYDNPPTKDSKWKVIHSIEGGCPAKGQSANMGQNAAAADPFTYPYTIPSDIPAGKGTIGFTWFNRIGNREMYMNCGALELTGEGGDMSNFEKLPDMVVLNIDGHATDAEEYDYKFREPGNSVENNLGANGMQVCGNDGCDTPTQSVDTSDAGSGSDTGSGSSSQVTRAPADPTPAPANGGGVFVTTGGAAKSSAAPVTSTTSVSTPAASTHAASTPVATPSPAAGSGSGAASGTCSPEGLWNCIDGKSYQQCAAGTWSTAMPMAPGTSCTPGQSAKLEVFAAGRRVRAFRA